MINNILFYLMENKNDCLQFLLAKNGLLFFILLFLLLYIKLFFNFIQLTVYLSFYLSFSVCLSNRYLSMHLFIYPNYLSCLSVYLSYLYVYQAIIYLSIYQYIYLFIYLSIYLGAHPLDLLYIPGTDFWLEVDSEIFLMKKLQVWPNNLSGV